MKTGTLLLFILMVISTVQAQEIEHERNRGFGGNPPHREMQHLRFAKYILSEKCITEAEITAEQVASLKKEFDLLDKKMFEINTQIEELSKRQAQVSIKVLTTPGDDGREMMKMTEEIGRLRTDQAKLSVKVLMVIRDHLHPQQRARLVLLMNEEREKMKTRQKFMRDRMQIRQPSPPDEL